MTGEHPDIDRGQARYFLWTTAGYNEHRNAWSCVFD